MIRTLWYSTHCLHHTCPCLQINVNVHRSSQNPVNNFGVEDKGGYYTGAFWRHPVIYHVEGVGAIQKISALVWSFTERLTATNRDLVQLPYFWYLRCTVLVILVAMATVTLKVTFPMQWTHDHSISLSNYVKLSTLIGSVTRLSGL